MEILITGSIADFLGVSSDSSSSIHHLRHLARSHVMRQNAGWVLACMTALKLVNTSVQSVYVSTR